uniref:Putative secreted protein n=1 Tax=Anopheles darlingi TaxID=43151 RepID=A0A2M4DM25_ANODA
MPDLLIVVAFAAFTHTPRTTNTTGTRDMVMGCSGAGGFESEITIITIIIITFRVGKSFQHQLKVHYADRLSHLKGHGTTRKRKGTAPQKEVGTHRLTVTLLA